MIAGSKIWCAWCGRQVRDSREFYTHAEAEHPLKLRRVREEERAREVFLMRNVREERRAIEAAA